ncbi:MAG TPA: hypothetical protein VMV18_02765 [bacterium]|nr:hypothetical protein [bacterium]
MNFRAPLTLLLLAAASACSSGAHHPDYGSPSASYPVAHDAMPQVMDYGGPVQDSPVFYSVTVAGDPLASQLADFLSRVGGSAYWHAATHDYGVGAGTFGGAVTIASPAASITGEQLKAMLNTMLDGTHPEYGTPSINANYVFYLPDGVQISDPNGTSCQSYGAYHGSFNITGGTYAGIEVTYSAMPRCNPAMFGFTQQIDELTFATSHEIAEAATDPSVEDGRYAFAGFTSADAAWNLLSGGEVGDMCIYYSDSPVIRPTDVGYPVQRIWSNAAALASHDPCQPSSGTFFNAAPVLPEKVSVSGLAVDAPAVIIPVGESKRIELDLFSDAQTSGPFYVTAIDAGPVFGLPQNLTLSVEHPSGVNGEKAYVTVHVDSVGTAWGLGQVEFFYVHAELGGRSQMWPVMVANSPTP